MNGLYRRSLEDHVPLEMIYLSDRNVLTHRKIVVKEIHSLYIKAYCYTRRQIRTFRRDQILSITIARQTRKLIV